MKDEPRLRASDLTPAGQRYFLQKTRAQFIFWAIVILALLFATGALLYFDLR
jgi:hypothetical protein